ncbi:MAG: Rpn family recombination-promoting nuclease/putative transposase [Lachnospiraceae bacterium]|nr:Rpn family recombination-promoting nuclease/putative transposase [Lachnospiraceae bacterium]
MGEKDMTERTLEAYNDVFADIVNVLLFKGERRVSEDALEDVESFSQYKADDQKLHEQERDVAKIWKNTEFRIALFGVEDQTDPDPDMPLRIMGYDGAGYRSQLLNGKKDRYPVVSIVLYFGTQDWKHTRLKDCFEIPEGLEPYVNDYCINLFEIPKLPMETVDQFTSDFRIVAEFFVKTSRKDEEYHPTEQQIKHVDEVLKLLRVMTKDDNIEDLFAVEKREGEHGKMESYFTVMLKKGISQGKEEDRTEVNELIRWLRAQGREEDLWQSLDDREFQDRLLEEMHAAKGDLVTV